MMRVSNSPALPTNGSPCASSSAPGASPTNISSASILPTPKTTDFREVARCGHFTQASTFSRNSANAAAFVVGSSGGNTGAGAGSGTTSGRDWAAAGLVRLKTGFRIGATGGGAATDGFATAGDVQLVAPP